MRFVTPIFRNFQRDTKKRKHQTTKVGGGIKFTCLPGILKITVGEQTGKKYEKNHPQNNLIISLSTPKLAAYPPLKKETSSSLHPGGFGRWMVVTPAPPLLTDVTLTDRQTDIRILDPDRQADFWGDSFRSLV